MGKEVGRGKKCIVAQENTGTLADGAYVLHSEFDT